jgi:hypothetical protein
MDARALWGLELFSGTRLVARNFVDTPKMKNPPKQ